MAGRPKPETLYYRSRLGGLASETPRTTPRLGGEPDGRVGGGFQGG
jgi:hypothetical protein